jgi:hypothetical protein
MSSLRPSKPNTNYKLLGALFLHKTSIVWPALQQLTWQQRVVWYHIFLQQEELECPCSNEDVHEFYVWFPYAIYPSQLLIHPISLLESTYTPLSELGLQHCAPSHETCARSDVRTNLTTQLWPGLRLSLLSIALLQLCGA